jgi:hypothetical protein
MQKILRLAVLLFMMISHGKLAAAENSPPQSNPESPRKGYAAEFTATIQMEGKEPQVVFHEIRYVSASGKWKSLQEHTGGKFVERFGLPGRGLFEVNHEHKELIRLAPYSPQPGLAPAQPRSQERFVRSERILGFDTDVFEVTFEVDDGTRLLLHRARQLGGAVVKLVRVNRSNTFTLEATRILQGEPIKEHFEHPEYSIVEGMPKTRGLQP